MMDETPGGWHLDKRVSVGHIVTTLMALLAALFAYANLETRVSVLEVQTNSVKEDIGEIKRATLRIEDKLDRKVDK
jgi:beta-lactam-binding protein with PASTA domain